MNRDSPIYIPACAEGFEWCLPEDASDFETVATQINGEPRATSWSSLPVRLLRQDKGKVLHRSDSPWLGSHALIFRSEAATKLGRLLTLHGELLPLSCQEAELVMFNPTHVIDALDEAASEVLRLGSGRIFQVKTYVFHRQVIGGVDVFKIPNLRSSPTFCSQRFVDRWIQEGLRGLEFKRVWPRRDTH